MREMSRQRAIIYAAVLGLNAMLIYTYNICRMNIHFALGSLLYNHQPNCGPSRIMFNCIHD